MNIDFEHICSCESLQIAEHEYLHEDICDLYAGGVTASAMRKRLNGVTLYMHSDVVLMYKPQKDMIGKPEVQGTITVNGQSGYIVHWIYPGVTLHMELTQYDHPKYGKVLLYAVQRIIANDKVKPTHKQKYRSGNSARRRSNKRR